MDDVERYYTNDMLFWRWLHVKPDALSDMPLTACFDDLNIIIDNWIKLDLSPLAPAAATNGKTRWLYGCLEAIRECTLDYLCGLGDLPTHHSTRRMNWTALQRANNALNRLEERKAIAPHHQRLVQEVRAMAKRTQHYTQMRQTPPALPPPESFTVQRKGSGKGV